MTKVAIFSGLVFDQDDQQVSTAIVGDEPYYVVNDGGFLRHIPSRDVDRQVWDYMFKQIEGKEDFLSEQAAKMMGQEDIFTVAMIESQLKNSEKQFEALASTGIPGSSRDYLGMMGFKVIIDLHGNVLEIKQPGIASDGEE